jgi:drug/metabolite transporter (DMT)-like permease
MPVLYMMFSVLSWSLFPLLSIWCIAGMGIFDYILLTYAVGLAATLGALWLQPGYRNMGLPGPRDVSARTYFEILLGCLTVLLSFACLLQSFSHLSSAGATVVYESWPIMAMYITPLLIQKGWETISRKDLVFSLLALAGIGFLMYPETRGELFAQGPTPKAVYFLVLPLLGGALMAVASVLKSRVSHMLTDKKHPVASLLNVQAFFSSGVILLSALFMLVFPDKHDVFTGKNIAAVVFVGIAIHTAGNVAYTKAILSSAKANIVALWYLMPIFSVLWLWWAGVSAVTPYIVWGAIFILISNLLMTIRADRSLSYIATLVGLLVCGLDTYFTDGNPIIGDYYQATSVPLFFYAILVAFMMERLINRDRAEEELAITVINHIEDHAHDIGKAAQKYKDHVLGIITTDDNAAIAEHYRVVRNVKNKHISAMHNELDQLVLSKSQGTSFSEMFTLFLVGLLTIVMLIVYRPLYFIADGYSIVLSLAVIFVFFTVLDLSNQRHRFYLERDAEGDMSLSQKLTDDLSIERVISVVMILCVLAALMGLLWVKHLHDAPPVAGG